MNIIEIWECDCNKLTLFQKFIGILTLPIYIICLFFDIDLKSKDSVIKQENKMKKNTYLIKYLDHNFDKKYTTSEVAETQDKAITQFDSKFDNCDALQIKKIKI